MQKHLTQKNPQNDFASLIIYSVIVVGISLLLFLLWKSVTLNVTISSYINLFKNSLFFPERNECFAGQIGQVNVLKLFYQFLALAIFISFIFSRFLIHAQKKPLSIILPQIVTMICIISLLLFAGIQQIHRAEFFEDNLILFGGKTVDEKNRLRLGEIYDFIMASRGILSNNHQCELITDLDLNQDLYITYHRILAYYLYPSASIRFMTKNPQDCLVLFVKKNPLKAISEDYQILVTTKDNNLILAIKKGSPL